MKKNKDLLTEQSKITNSFNLNVYADAELLLNPTNDKWRIEFINKMIAWASRETSISLLGFLRQHGIMRSVFYQWCEDYPDIKSAFEEMKLLFADNRLSGSVFKKMDYWAAHRGVGLLDPEQHAVNVYEAALKQKEESKDIQFIVINAKPEVGTKEDLRRNVDETL